MKINGEPVEPVTDFATLKPGMILYDKRCSATGCGKEWCRAMILGTRSIDGEWYLLPNCSTASQSVVSGRAVAQGRIYAVVNPLDAQTTARKREAVRG